MRVHSAPKVHHFLSNPIYCYSFTENMGSLFNYSGRHVLKTCIPKPTILRITSPHLTYPLRALLRIKYVFFPILASGQQCEANSTPPISKKKALVDYVLSLLTEVS